MPSASDPRRPEAALAVGAVARRAALRAGQLLAALATASDRRRPTWPPGTASSPHATAAATSTGQAQPPGRRHDGAARPRVWQRPPVIPRHARCDDVAGTRPPTRQAARATTPPARPPVGAVGIEPVGHRHGAPQRVDVAGAQGGDGGRERRRPATAARPASGGRGAGRSPTARCRRPAARPTGWRPATSARRPRPTGRRRHRGAAVTAGTPGSQAPAVVDDGLDHPRLVGHEHLRHEQVDRPSGASAG